MKLPDEAQARRPHNGAGLLDSLTGLADQLLASANGLIEVKADRVRLAMRHAVVTVVLASVAALCAGIWLGAAALAAVRGLCGGFTALWGGRQWLGELCGGVLALALAAGLAALLLRLATRRELIRLEAKYERIRNKSGTSEDSGAAARPRGSAGTPAHQRSGATAG